MGTLRYTDFRRYTCRGSRTPLKLWPKIISYILLKIRVIQLLQSSLDYKGELKTQYLYVILKRQRKDKVSTFRRVENESIERFESEHNGN